MSQFIIKEKLHNCLIIIFFIFFLRSECIRLGKNIRTPDEIKYTTSPPSLDDIMSINNELIPESITYSKLVTFPKETTCSNHNCHLPYGKCMDQVTCECDEWHMDVPYLSHSSTNYCTYRQKSQVVSFVLELMFLSGIGHLYASRSVIGFVKLIFSLIIVIVMHFMNSHVPSENESLEGPHPTIPKNKILKYLPYFLIFFFFTVQIIDLFLIERNYYLDGYGIPMKDYKFK